MGGLGPKLMVSKHTLEQALLDLSFSLGPEQEHKELWKKMICNLTFYYSSLFTTGPAASLHSKAVGGRRSRGD